LVGLLLVTDKIFYMQFRKTMTTSEKVFFNKVHKQHFEFKKVRKVKSNICEKKLLNQRILLNTPNIHGNKFLRFCFAY
jgi:hypothetical protein